MTDAESSSSVMIVGWLGTYLPNASKLATTQAMNPQTGKVRIQAVTISRPTPQRTAENRRVDPTPMMAVLIV